MSVPESQPTNKMSEPESNSTAIAGSSPVPCSPSLDTPVTDAIITEWENLIGGADILREYVEIKLLESHAQMEREWYNEMGFRGEWCHRYRESHSELMAMKERLLALSDSFEESQISHGKLRDGTSLEVSKMCHAGAADAYAHAKRMVREAIHGATEF